MEPVTTAATVAATTDLTMLKAIGAGIAAIGMLGSGIGLGLMIGTGTEGHKVLGHTGGGPDSTIAVYRNDESGCTAAAFSPGDDTNAVESAALDAVRPKF